MSIEHIQIKEAMLLHEHYELSLVEIAELSGISEQQLIVWVEEGMLAPRDVSAQSWTFGADRLKTVMTACRLRSELDLDDHALTLTVNLLERIRLLEAEIRNLRAQIPEEM